MESEHIVGNAFVYEGNTNRGSGRNKTNLEPFHEKKIAYIENLR